MTVKPALQTLSNNNCQLTLVVINYFCADQTIALIKTIAQIVPSEINLNIVCADNSDDAFEYKRLSEYKALSPQLELSLIFNKLNLGFGKAINQALENNNADYILLINPDVTLNKDSLEHLLRHAHQNSHQGIWGGITLRDNNELDYRHAWREPTLLRTLAWATGLRKVVSINATIDNYTNISSQTSQSYSVDSVSGCCMLISQSAWCKTEGFDENFFLYSEELDLCRRARSAGFQPTVIPQATLEHAISHTADNPNRLAILYNAKFIYAHKHHGLIYSAAFRIIIALGAIIRSTAFFLTGKKQFSKSWFTIFCNSFKPITTSQAAQQKSRSQSHTD